MTVSLSDNMVAYIWSICIITCCFVTWSYAQPDSSLVIDGDVIIAGLFQMQTSEAGDCGEVDVPSVLSMEAIRWYLNTVNAENALNFKVGFRYYTTCGNTDVAREHAVDILQRYYRSQSTDTTEDFIVGVIGPELSSESTIVSSVLSSQTSSNRFLQIGSSSTSTELNDRKAYPNYYRVIPDDSVQMKAMVELMLALEWNRVSILFENDTYGRVGAEELQRLAQENNICVSRSDAIKIDSSRRVDANEVKGLLEDMIIQSPHITGVVYVGSMTVANAIFRIVAKQDYQNVPIFLLSESIQLQNQVFYSTDGSELTKTRGAMTVSPPMLNTPMTNNFWDYIRTMLTDSQAFLNASQINPHLAQVATRYNKRCSASSNCYPLTQSEVNTLISDRSPYVHYALLAAETMEEALRKTYNTHCPGETCLNIDGFKTKFKPSDMLDAMDGLSVSFNTTAGSFIYSTPNIQLTSAASLYEVYNYRTNVGDNTKFQFVQVGYLSENKLTLEKDVLRDYDANAIVLKYPDLRRGTCPVKAKCGECIPGDLNEAYLHIPGDFYVVDVNFDSLKTDRLSNRKSKGRADQRDWLMILVGGLKGIASINERAIPGPLGCGKTHTRNGYQLYLSLKFGLAEFQSRRTYTQYKDMLGNHTIGLIVINSCNNELEIVRRILDLHSNGLPLSDGKRVDLTGRILAYIGGQSTDVSKPAAVQLTKLNFVQISYSASNPSLSNKDLYPYFMRIITPDNVQAKALIDIVKALHGEYIQIMYSEGAYGEGGRDAVVKVAKDKYVCIAQEIKVLESDTYYEYYEIMRKKPHAKIVIIFLRAHIVRPFLRDVKNSQMEAGEFQFVGSEAWGRNSEVLDYDITRGALTVSVEMDTHRDLEEYIQDQLPSFPEANPWLLDYIQNRQDCYFRWSFDKSFSRPCTPDILPTSDLEFVSDPWCIFVFNTVISFLKGSSTFLKDRCGSHVGDKLCSGYTDHPRDLVEVLKKVKLNIYGDGDELVFDDQGDGRMGYKIYNIQDHPDDKTKRDYFPVGSYSLSTGLLLDVLDVRYPTRQLIVSSCPSKSACMDCQEIEQEEEPVVDDKSADSITPVLGTIIGLCCVVIVVLSVCLIRCYRKGSTKEDPYINPCHLEERRSADGHYVEHEFGNEIRT